MRKEVLLDLAARWEEHAKNPDTQDGSPDAAIGNARAEGARETKRECADAIRMLVSVLG